MFRSEKKSEYTKVKMHKTKDLSLKDCQEFDPSGARDRSDPSTGAYATCFIKFISHDSMYHMPI